MAISTVERFLKFFPTIIDNTTEKFSSPEELVKLLNDLGWDFPIDKAPNFEALVETINGLIEAVFKLEDANEILEYLSALSELAQELYNTVSVISDIKEFFESIGDAWQALPAFIEEFPQQLVDYLIIDYLENYYPGVFTFLQIAHIIEIDKHYTPQLDGQPTPDRIPYDRKTLHLTRLADFVGDPSKFLRDIYKWGIHQFDSQMLLNKLEEICIDLNLPAGQYNAHPTIASNLLGIENPTHALIGKELHIPIYEKPDEDIGYVETGVNIYPIPAKDGLLPGLSFTPYFNGDAELKVDFGGFELLIDGDFSTGLGIEVRPGNILTRNDLLSNQPINYEGKIKATFSKKPPHEFLAIFGKDGQTRLGFHNIIKTVGIEVKSNEEQNLFFELCLSGGEFALDPTNGDGFISKILSNLKIESFFELTIGWSSKEGIYFKGSGDLVIYLPTHIPLGLLELISTFISIAPRDGEIPISLGTSIKGDLGPLKFAIENIGFSTNFAFPDNNSGNLGPVDINFGFKPPDGVGLSINLESVKGGGYLKIDREKGEYFGYLELTIVELVSVKAIALITTRMPDGSDGYSVLIILTAEFGTGIQLGFGFSLLAVGGLVGIHRAMNQEQFAKGVRDGSVESVMFPANIAENAPRIINDLNAFFPLMQDQYLVGPMAKIGWGTKSLIQISLGVIIEFSGDIGILGIVKVSLPDEDAPAILLQVNFIGALEFSKKRIWFFASLYHSRVLSITLDGDFGLLISWGKNATFLISVGGFHPAFHSPSLPFPNLVRVCVSLINESWAKVRVIGYFAVTSNTVQFGARAEIFFGIDDFCVEGHFAFDALFQFSPFYFIIAVSASFSVEVFGMGLFSIRVQLSLEGPTPWRAKGTGYISVLLFEFEVDFDVTWGENKHDKLRPILIKDKLLEELNSPVNWKAELPSGNKNLVTIRKEDEDSNSEGEEVLIMHPVGYLVVSQRFVPTDITLDFVGNQVPADYKKFSFGVNGSLIPVFEQFAMAQYQKMSKTEKLSRPSYEDNCGGVKFMPQDGLYKTGKATTRTIRYEEQILDVKGKRSTKQIVKGISRLMERFLFSNTATKSELSIQVQNERINPDTAVILSQGNFVITNIEDNGLFIEEGKEDFQAVFASEALAREYYNDRISNDPNLVDTIQIMPQTELNFV